MPKMNDKPKKPKTRKRKSEKKRKDGKTQAERADKYELYQKSVQEPSVEVDFFDATYRKLNKRAPKVLREDFCGTFAVSCEWAKESGRFATAVDLDPEPLAWGREHNLAALPPAAQKRVRVIQDDVRTNDDRKADILAAQNFSYWIFQTRDELRAYFEIARQNLARDGLFVLDMMGGGDCYQEKAPEERKYKGFRYHWEMGAFDPITHAATHYIHYSFKDGSRLDKAFEYHWRFWTIPEIREVLAEAGFANTTVYWESEDENGYGTDEWEPQEHGTCDPSWIAYIVAQP
jgi:hypothetical protein